MTDPSFAGEGIYRENILDHYKNPRNSGTLASPAFTRKEFNPLCGDEITVFATIKDKRIQEFRFQGSGCAISQAAASLLSEELKGKTLEEIKSLQSEQVIGLLGIPISPARLKCATLGLVALKSGLASYEERKGE